MCDCVLWDIESRNAQDFSRDQVVAQFGREFRVPVGDLERRLEEMARFRKSIGNRLPFVFFLFWVFCIALRLF